MCPMINHCNYHNRYPSCKNNSYYELHPSNYNHYHYHYHLGSSESPYYPVMPYYPYPFLLPTLHIPITGTVNTNCNDETEYTPYDFPIPWPLTTEITNRGDCPVRVYIYYTDAFVKKRLYRDIQPGEHHEFDRVWSCVAVSIICESIRCNGQLCDNPDRCIVDYNIY